MAGEKIVGAALNKVRQLNPLGLFSKGAEEAAALKQAKGTPEQMRAMLLKQGVKPAELENAGFNAAFFGRPSVTKDEIAQFLQDRAPKIEEKVLGSNEAAYDAMAPLEEMLQEHLDANQIRKLTRGQTSVSDLDPSIRTLAERYMEAHKKWKAGWDYGNPKFQQYTIPGGENYREMLLKASDDYVDDLAKRSGSTAPNANDYISSHWDDPNVLAHLRMSDRMVPSPGFAVVNQRSGFSGPVFDTEAEAMADMARYPESIRNSLKIAQATGSPKKVLHVEEIQSDWGQEGRKKGFSNPGDAEKFSSINDQLSAARSELAGHLSQIHQDVLGSSYRNWLSTRPDQEAKDSALAAIEQLKAGSQNYASSESRVRELEAALSQANPASKVPSAPYVTSTPGWTDLALKRALREAAEGDYHAMAWTPGAEQAARYPGGGDKMAAGLTAYYNKIVPTQLQKMTRELDPNAQLGTTAINDVQAPSLTITPQMREKIKQGLPLFAAPVAATLGAEEQPAGFARGGYAEGGPAMDDNQILALLKSLYAGGAQLRDPSGGAGLDRSQSFAPAPLPEGAPQFDMRAPYRSTTQMPGSVPAMQAREFAPTNVEEALRRVRQMEPQREVPLPPRRPASLDRRPEPVREPVRKPEVNASRSLWDRYNETGSAADFIAANNAMREGHAGGGHVLSDDYPTHYMPHVGRQVMAGGGEAEAQRALDLANDIRSYERQMREINAQPEEYRQMTHAPERPRAPIQVEGGFIGKRTLGSAPYDVAGPLAGAAQAAYDMKTLPLYFTPVAPYAMAADIGEGMAAGSPSQVAMSALGPMGRAGRTVAGMATGATAALSPDEARAEGAYRPILDDRLIDILRRYASGGSVSHRALMVSSKDT